MYKGIAYINGEFITNDKTIEIISPETNKPVGVVVSLTQDNIKYAYSSAKNAQSKWEALAKEQRIKLMEKWALLIENNKEDIAKIMVAEIAKSLKSSISEIERTIEYIHATIIEYKKMKTEHLKFGSSKEADIYLKPLGVILVISPFNYPINLSMTKIAPSLLTGNTIVFKSATNGTLSCSKMIELADQAGFPKGVINFVTGKGSEIGDSLIANNIANAIMFTGGTETGLKIAKDSTMKYLMFELGGKDPAIVCEDANLEFTVEQIIIGAFSYSGQRCTAIKRVYVHKNIKDKFLKLLVEKVNKLTVGKAIDNCDITSLINKHSTTHIKNLLNDAIEKGATPLNKISISQNLVHPVILDNVTNEMNISYEEQFGPILPILEYKSIEEVIERANDTKYGLQASIFTKNVEFAKKIAMKLEVGTVNINGPSQRGPDILPFIGVKGSGLITQGVKYALNSVVREFNIVNNKQ